MSTPRVDFALYLITDRTRTGSRSLCATVEEALIGGVRAVQLREKDLTPGALYELAAALRRLTSAYGARLFINDRIDVALASGADGVHLATTSLPVAAARRLAGKRLLVGASCHDLASARAAEDAGADFITFGPVFFTPSKAEYGEPVGIDQLGVVCNRLHIPVFGLGGVTRERTPEVLAAGARGIALISAILAAEDPREETERLLSLMRQHSTP